MSMQRINNLLRCCPAALTLDQKDCPTATPTKVASTARLVLAAYREADELQLDEGRKRVLAKRLQRAGYCLNYHVESYDRPKMRKERGQQYQQMNQMVRSIADTLGVTPQHLQCPSI